MFKALNNYTQSAIDTYTQTGEPLQRALFYEYPQDTHSWKIEHQYIYGSELLVAPVLEVSNTNIYMPIYRHHRHNTS